MSIQTQQLNDFLIFAAENGYANPKAVKTKQTDGSDTISLKQNDFELNDNYFTSEDGRRFHGREVIFHKNKPYWFVAYSGFVTKATDPDNVYGFLKQAMLKPMKKFPVRGPKNFAKENWNYCFKDIMGNINEFSAIEVIKLNNQEVYKAYFIGGIIN